MKSCMYGNMDEPEGIMLREISHKKSNILSSHFQVESKNIQPIETE